jgi:alkylhydroperoxidase/carboxymuconolactone decarboxylase family protein YurZ
MPKPSLSPLGDATRRKILGDEHVDSLMDKASEFDYAWHQYVTNINWGGTWSRGILPQQQLSLINLAMLAGAGQMTEFERHFRIALKTTRVPLEQLRELLLHIGQYCGIPTGAEIFLIARRVMEQEGIDRNQLAPLDTSGLYASHSEPGPKNSAS